MENIRKPNYNNCILNTITSILKYYKVETEHESLECLDKILERKYKNVVLLILDGMGEHILNNISPDRYFKKHQIATVTSVYPSTTTAALTTYYSGRPPIETGWIAWSQYFKEYGRAIDMLSHTESYKRDSLDGAAINVFETVVNYDTIFSRIENTSNIKTFEIMPTYSDRRSKRTIKADNLDEMTEAIELLCELPEEKFIMAYSDNPDGILHKYGTDSEEAKKFVINAEEKISKMMEKISKDTVVIISADHGHKNIDKAYNITDYPELQECFIMPPSLESRCMTFWIREDMKKEFEIRFKKIFNDEFILLKGDEFLKEHYLGFGKQHRKVNDFLGDYIAISTSGSIIKLETYLAEGKKVKKSTHCGLTKEEMDVPVIVMQK